ncbi:MAG TPA: hypothetical protein VNO52_18005, partial [Methylomirabilota bacterium]|nr:hypothetical protein [Methylomirabilota bacterium]
MRRPCWWPGAWRLGLALWVGWLGIAATGRAQDAVEARAFRAAARAFQDGIYDLAAREFGQFVQRFPASPHVTEAVLLHARAALRMQQASVAIDLLTTNAPRAGPLAD